MLMVVISVIIPAHNAAGTILETLQALQDQQFRTPQEERSILLELSIHDDGSTDDTFAICQEFIATKWTRGRAVLSQTKPGAASHGPGYARNRCIEQCTGQFLLFNDADDISLPFRAQQQLDLWRLLGSHNVLVGSRFTRLPEDATRHYTEFINSLTTERDLWLKQYRELTIIQPTWFLSKQLLLSLSSTSSSSSSSSPYSTELGEDLILFHQLLDLPDLRLRVCEDRLVVYRHVQGSGVSSKTPRRDLVRIRVAAFERRVLRHWPKFSVWGAGRDGRAFFEFLSEESKRKITMFADVSAGRLSSGFHHSGFILPVRHFTEIEPPFVVCVAMGRTEGELERNIASVAKEEGIDYWHFT